MPSIARIYDCFLDGKDNYEVDRVAAADIEIRKPTVKLAARANRAFMRRATRYLAAEAGIRQFLDIGAGIPAQPNLHQVAQEAAPESRVVYVDNDPIVLAHARALLYGSPEGRTAYVAADVTAPESILASPALRATLDLTQPVALCMFALMHFVPDTRDPYGVVSTLLAALAPGSYLVMSHGTGDFDPQGTAEAAAEYHRRGLPMQTRSRDEFTRFFADLDLVDPGVVPPHRWRPDSIPSPASTDAKVSFYAAVART
ncbi:MAG: SAM-dependent methyltransferase [Mycobacteriaceae bacterium]|nr:SAM-dependent methyltransferase [Mycobacteriaceae bacterium]